MNRYVLRMYSGPISKFLVHSAFLWAYHPAAGELTPKQPAYRTMPQAVMEKVRRLLNNEETLYCGTTPLDACGRWTLQAYTDEHGYDCTYIPHPPLTQDQHSHVAELISYDAASAQEHSYLLMTGKLSEISWGYYPAAELWAQKRVWRE